MTENALDPAAGQRNRLRGLMIWITAMSLVAGVVGKLADQLQVHSPWEQPAQWFGFVTAGVAAVAIPLTAKHGKDIAVANTLFWAIIVAAGLIVVFAGLMIFTHNPIDLKPRERLVGEIGANSSTVHRFTGEAADNVFIRVRSLTTGLDLSPVIEKGRTAVPLGLAPGEAWVAETTLGEGGTWDLVIRSGDRKGEYEVRLTVEHGLQIEESGKTLSRQQLVRPGHSNGYVYVVEAAEEMLVIVESLTSGLDLVVTVLRDGDRRSLPVAGDDRHEIPVATEAGSSYVIVVESPSGATGWYSIEVQEGIVAMPPTSTTTTGPSTSTTLTGPSTSTTTTRPPTSTTIAVPPTSLPPNVDVPLLNLYEFSQAAAESTLIDLGLAVQVVSVCSSSVDDGLVRRAFLLDEDDNEVVVVDQDGVLPPGEAVPSEATVYLEVSTGQPCG